MLTVNYIKSQHYIFSISHLIQYQKQFLITLLILWLLLRYLGWVLSCAIIYIFLKSVPTYQQVHHLYKWLKNRLVLYKEYWIWLANFFQTFTCRPPDFHLCDLHFLGAVCLAEVAAKKSGINEHGGECRDGPKNHPNPHHWQQYIYAQWHQHFCGEIIVVSIQCFSFFSLLYLNFFDMESPFILVL